MKQFLSSLLNDKLTNAKLRIVLGSLLGIISVGLPIISKYLPEGFDIPNMILLNIFFGAFAVAWLSSLLFYFNSLRHGWRTKDDFSDATVNKEGMNVGLIIPYYLLGLFIPLILYAAIRFLVFVWSEEEMPTALALAFTTVIACAGTFIYIACFRNIGKEWKEYLEELAKEKQEPIQESC